jgi:hypothetical protein
MNNPGPEAQANAADGADPRGPLRTRLLDPVVVLTLCAVALWCSHYYLLLPGRLYTLKHEDDACYYMKIAENLFHGHPFTFDGINPTNGFHPLWVVLSCPLFLFTDEPGTYTRLYFGLQYILFLACGAGIYFVLMKITRGRRVVSAAVSLFFLLDGYFYKVIINGLETPLFVLLCVLTMWAFLSFGPRAVEDSRTAAVLGLLCSLLVLSRLEGGAVHALALALAYGALARRGGRMRPALVFLVTLALPVSFFAAASAWYNGSPIPVSGAAKRAAAMLGNKWSLLGLIDYATVYDFQFPHVVKMLRFMGADWISKMPGIIGDRRSYSAPGGACAVFSFLLSLVVYALAALAVAHRCLKQGVQKEELALASFSIGAALLVALDKILYKSGVIPYWYPVTYSIAQILMIGRLISLSSARTWAHPLVRFALVAGLVIALLHFKRQHDARGRFLAEPTGYTQWYEEAVWIRKNTPPEAVIAAHNAGIIGFYSRRRVVNLDGLVNSREYWERVLAETDVDRRTRELHRFLREWGVTFFADIYLRSPEDPLAWLRPDGKRVTMTRVHHIEPTPPDSGGGVIYRIDYGGDE